MPRTQLAAGPEKKALIILGMHRSGTSALAGSLRLCGAWVGEEHDLTRTSIENPKGFWERRDMRAICDGLLHAAGADWRRVTDFETSAIPHVALKEKCRAFGAIVTELDSHGTWVVKEPRLCLLFPVLRTLIADPVCIHIYRNPLEVAYSLRARNGLCIAEGLALWEFYNISALRASEGQSRVLVSYEALISHPEETLRTLIGELTDLGVGQLVKPDREAIQKFILRGLRRQMAGVTETSDFISPSQRELWLQLQNGKALQVRPPPALNHVAREYLRDLETRTLAQETQEQSTKDLVAELQAQKARTKDLVAKLQAQKAQSKTELAKLKNSTSWRITAPLRGVSRGQKWLLRSARQTSNLIRSAMRRGSTERN